MDQNHRETNFERILDLTNDLQVRAASLQGADDLEGMLPLVRDIKEIVDGTVDRLREAFASAEWRDASRGLDRPGDTSESNTFSSIYEATSKIASRLEDTFRKSQLLSMELEELDRALRGFLPVYRLGADTFLQGDDADRVIREACESIGRLLQESFGTPEDG